MKQFIDVTGASRADAEKALEASKGDVDRALTLHFDVGEEEDGAEPRAEEPNTAGGPAGGGRRILNGVRPSRSADMGPVEGRKTL